jgi:hypothetical protein
MPNLGTKEGDLELSVALPQFITRMILPSWLFHPSSQVYLLYPSNKFEKIPPKKNRKKIGFHIDNPLDVPTQKQGSLCIV